MRPFLLPASGRTLFCVYRPPGADVAPRGSVLHIPAFAEEMHKSRRMTALQARDLARQGFGVLMLDPTGCGDSSGDFADARWDVWLDDLRLGLEWLRAQVSGPCLLWALRLGVLLALELTQQCREAVSSILMWQPVTSGERYLTELLRIKMAAEIVAGRKASVQALRQALNDGRVVEIGGYGINPSLAAALDRRTISELAVPDLPAGWVEIVTAASDSIPATSQRVIDALSRSGMKVHAETVAGQPFWDWNAADITECRELLPRTQRTLDLILERR